mmetsp:Transcript_30119/g.64986  ORF Transcript_30119/g.64986 Transcript_30119/m.64986 type:complete len:426 (-) Transcript_30119:114-1391(-)
MAARSPRRGRGLVIFVVAIMLTLFFYVSEFLGMTRQISARNNGTVDPPVPRTMLQGTMVLQIAGELGNHIAYLAYYFAVRTIASTEFNLNLTLHVRKQNHRKSISAARNVQCLKSFRHLDFDECDWFKTDNNKNGKKLGELCMMKISNQSEALLDLERSSNNQTISTLSSSLSMSKHETSNDIRSSLRDYVAMLQDDSILQMYRTMNVGWNSDEPYPFLYNLDSRYSDRMVASDTLIDEFYGRGLPQYFAFDTDTKTNGGCCAMLPTEDEQVFHHRSFVTDLPRKIMWWGGAELKPQQSAEMLSSALPPETRIALVAGRANRDRIVSYANAFRNHSFRVREIAGQSAIQDFCFLAHARAGLWGTVQSSYARWASLIGGELLRNATIYGVNYPAREVNVTSRVSTNEDLAGRIHYPVFNVTDADVW